MDFKNAGSQQREAPSYRLRSRSNSVESENQVYRLEQSAVASAYSTIHNPSSFSPNHPRNFRPIQVFLHNCWARSNYEMDFEEEELPQQVDGNLTFSSMYRRIQTEDGEWKENTNLELQSAPILKDSALINERRKISQNIDNPQQLKRILQSDTTPDEENRNPQFTDCGRQQSPINRLSNEENSGSETDQSGDEEQWGFSFLNPEVEIPDHILQEAQLRFARLKRKRKHPRILRLIKEDRAMTDKMRIDGSALKSSKQPNSPESPKRDYFSKSSRFKAENLLKLQKSPHLSDRSDSLVSRKSTDSLARSDSDSSSHAPNSPIAPPTPGTPQYSQYFRGSKSYEKFLEQQLESRGQKKKSDEELGQYIENNLRGEIEKPRSVTMGGMDSATALRMNKNRKNLPTKGNDKMKLGPLMNSKIFMRRTQSQNNPEGESMLSIGTRKEESQEKASSEKGFAGRRAGLMINISKSNRQNEVKRL